MRATCQCADVEDEGHPTVTKNRRAGVGADSLELPRQRLDDDFLGVQDAIDDKTESTPVSLEDKDVHGLVNVRRVCQIENVIEPDKRDQSAAQAEDRCTREVLDTSSGFVSFEAQQLVKADLRNRVALTGALDR